MAYENWIQEDVRINSDGMDRLEVEKLLEKLFKKDRRFWLDDKFKGRDWGDILCEFWDQWQEFNTRKGLYYSRPHIWASEDIRNGKTYLWHAKYSKPYARILGMFGMRVCSKILGIGSAERAWGDVKHLKTDKRSHLSGDKTEKQATIYGRTCIERAELKKKRSLFGAQAAATATDLPAIWDDEDFDEVMEMYGYEAVIPKKRKRTFNAWLEDWEKEIVQTKGDLNELKLLEKNGGLSWKDPDCGSKIFTADTQYMLWQDKRKKNFTEGYCVYGIREDYNPLLPDTHEDNDDKWEPWDIQDPAAPIYFLIKTYYKENPCSHLEIVTEKTAPPSMNVDKEINEDEDSE